MEAAQQYQLEFNVIPVLTYEYDYSINQIVPVIKGFSQEVAEIFGDSRNIAIIAVFEGNS